MLAIFLLVAQASALAVNVGVAPPSGPGWFDRIRRRERIAITRAGQVRIGLIIHSHTHIPLESQAL